MILKAVEELAGQYASVPVTIRNAVSDIVYYPKKGYDERVALILDDGKKLIVDIEDMKDTLSPSPSITRLICKVKVIFVYSRLREEIYI